MVSVPGNITLTVPFEWDVNSLEWTSMGVAKPIDFRVDNSRKTLASFIKTDLVVVYVNTTVTV
jgi:hypothetical protein